MQKKVILGLSGGVDSSVAALLLKKSGYEVIGVFMKNYSDTKNHFGECSWVEEKRMAEKIADLLEINFFVVDYERQYKTKIIKKMIKDYEKFLTPNPDTLCNKIIKFPVLFQLAKKFKADFVATGHYARIKKRKGNFFLLRGKDKKKDQSYFLYELEGQKLKRILFPIGNLTKEEVRKIALKNNFPNWNKKGTSGVCFIGKSDMKDFLKKRIKKRKGKILLYDGQIIGEHCGAMFFTIGEKITESKGAFVNKEIKNKYGKLYVADKRKDNILVVAPKGNSALKRKKVFVKNLHLINEKEKIPKVLVAQIRHLGELHKGKLKKEKGNVVFVFNKEVESVAPGQKIVFYKGEKVIGGGEIR